LLLALPIPSEVLSCFQTRRHPERPRSHQRAEGSQVARFASAGTELWSSRIRAEPHPFPISATQMLEESVCTALPVGQLTTSGNL
jgi:hypothetical protein